MYPEFYSDYSACCPVTLGKFLSLSSAYLDSRRNASWDSVRSKVDSKSTLSPGCYGIIIYGLYHSLFLFILVLAIEQGLMCTKQAHSPRAIPQPHLYHFCCPPTLIKDGRVRAHKTVTQTNVMVVGRNS